MIQAFLVSAAVLLRIISNPLGNVFQKRLILAGKHPLAVNFYAFFFLSVPGLALAFQVNWSSLRMTFWFYAILAGILSAFGNGFLIKALEKGDLSILGPINAYKALVGMLGGFLFLGEIPGFTGMAGTVLIIFGSYFILETTPDRFTWKLLKREEIQFRIVALVLTAIEAVFMKKIVLLSSIETASLVWCWFGMVFSLVFLVLQGINPVSEGKKLNTDDWGMLLGLVLCVAIMLYTTLFAFSQMPVGYALSLFQLSSIASVLLGYRFFNEQSIRRKLWGAFIMVLGSVVIILGQKA